MPDRRVYFYRAFCGRDHQGEPLPFDAGRALQEVRQLDFFDDENGAYFDLGDGDLAFCVVDQLQANVKGVTFRITWDDPENPSERLAAELLVPIHEDAYPHGIGE